jgi:hypothetical protein
LVNTYITSQTSSNSFFDNIDKICTNSVSSSDPMKRLIEMGFANRVKNQRLLKENANDLAKVIELLSLYNNDDVEWYAHRH